MARLTAVDPDTWTVIALILDDAIIDEPDQQPDAWPPLLATRQPAPIWSLFPRVSVRTAPIFRYYGAPKVSLL